MLGVKRGGTTSLYRWLLEHPSVLPMFPSARLLPMRADLKGVHFFDARFDAGPAWYRSHFPSRLTRGLVTRRTGSRTVAGESTPYYLHHPLAAARARAVIPDVRLVVLLRDPVERAWSHFKEQRRRGFEPLERFEDALDAEEGRLLGEAERLLHEQGSTSFAHEHQSYVATSRYVEALDRWTTAFPVHQVLVLASEDLYRSPEAVYERVLSFLDLPPASLDSRPHNRTQGELPAATRRRLIGELAPDTLALEAALGRRFDWSTSS